MPFSELRTPVPALFGLAITAFLIQGYHLGADDAAIYVPSIKHAADPALFPFGSEFLTSHARLSLFPQIVALSARLTHLGMDTALLAWQIGGIFLLLLAGWKLLEACFTSFAAHWGGVVLLAAVLSVPVAGTGLFITDPYITARTLSTPATLFTIAAFVSGQRLRAFLWLILTAAVHPQMAVYTAFFLVLLCLPVTSKTAAPAAIALPWPLEPQPGPARDALLSRTFFFVNKWEWYEWIGVIAPLGLIWWFTRLELPSVRPAAQKLARAMLILGLTATAGGLTLISSPRLENYTRLQPMRAFHLVYIIFFLLLGGLLGEYVLREHKWPWIVLFLPLAIGMCAVQIATYPASGHIEWPGTHSQNPWTEAFLWIRHNTPAQDVFALDPGYMKRPGEDMHGFRAIAERSMLADAVKDSGVVSLFPALGVTWRAQAAAAQGWRNFSADDFRRLATLYPVRWFVIELPTPTGLDCPFRNAAIAVCRLQKSY